MRAVAQAVIESDRVLTVPVSHAVQKVIEEWAIDHGEDLNQRLEKFGLGSHNIVSPEYHRVVTPGEVVKVVSA